MSTIVPTITAYDVHEYRVQMERVKSFAKRLHVDLMDGIFAPTKSPDIGSLWLPEKIMCDIHIMYQYPHHQLRKLLALNPHMIIVQAEANESSVDEIIKHLKKTKVKVGVSLLAETRADTRRVQELIKKVDHVLVFSGHLGYHGGVADLSLLDKVQDIRALHNTVEIGWDGGINQDNAMALYIGGVDVLNVGGAVQGAKDPLGAYTSLSNVVAKSIVEVL